MAFKGSNKLNWLKPSYKRNTGGGGGGGNPIDYASRFRENSKTAFNKPFPTKWIAPKQTEQQDRLKQLQASQLANNAQRLEYLQKAQAAEKQRIAGNILRQRFLSNVMGPRRNNFDVGLGDIQRLNALNSMWGSRSVTEQERILRQNATQPGLMWTPYGIHGKTAYVPVPTSTNMFNGIGQIAGRGMQAAQSIYGAINSGGGGGGYNYGDYDYGGGGGSYDYSPEYYNNLMTWKIK